MGSPNAPSSTESSAPTDSFVPWWGDYTVRVQHMYHWHLGALRSWILRDANEWRVAWEAGRNPLYDANTCEGPTAANEAAFSWNEPPDSYTLARYSMHPTEATLHVQPALADRGLVVRPEHPISIPPNEAVTLFVSTPLWMRVMVHEREQQLLEMPTVRLSDTWFGASTRAGELCYATRTTGQLHLENVPRRPHRAITPIRIRNQGHDTLLLERVQMPAPPPGPLRNQHLHAMDASADSGARSQPDYHRPRSSGAHPPRRTARSG